MDIREIRTLSGLSQGAFCEKYKIPLASLKNWEADKAKSNHRNCPEYLKYLLERVVRMDFNL